MFEKVNTLGNIQIVVGMFKTQNDLSWWSPDPSLPSLLRPTPGPGISALPYTQGLVNLKDGESLHSLQLQTFSYIKVR